MTLALLDYGAGNLTSVRKGFSAAGAELVTAVRPQDLENARGIVVPGVGHFAATVSLDESWRRMVLARTAAGVPLLGICLGMQWLFEGSDEAPGQPGLGLFEGRCVRLEVARPLKVPHVGWNAVHPRRAGGLLDGIGAGVQVYFTHAFAAPVTSDCLATATHGGPFAAVVQREHVAGVQFHPEKSGEAGLGILRNFVALTRR